MFSRRPSKRDPDGNDERSLEVEENERRSGWPAKLSGHRRVLWTGLGLLVIAVGFGCWLGVRAMEAKTSLQQARHSAAQAKDALLKGNSTESSQWADQARSHAQAAHDATHSLPWNIASAVPWLGSPFKTGQQISDVVLGLATDVLQPSAATGAALSPDRLLRGNRLDVQLPATRNVS